MDLAQVTLAQMRYAVSIAETQNFRQAATLCHVSQSGLSMQVQKLEELLGVVLFDRSKKPVVETDAGTSALAQMRAILRETERLGQVVSDEEGLSGPYRLGVIPTLSPTVLPLFLRDFTRKYPRVELIVEELKTEDIISALHADKLDAGLAATPLHVPGFSEVALGLEPMFAYLGPGDPLRKKKQVTQAELRARHLWVMPEGHCFRSQVLSYCAASAREELDKAAGPVRFESGSFQTLIHLVDDGLGATILPGLVITSLTSARRRAQVRPLVSPQPFREIGLVRARTDLRANVTRALSKLMQDKLGAALETLRTSGPGAPSKAALAKGRAVILDPQD